MQVYLWLEKPLSELILEQKFSSPHHKNNLVDPQLWFKIDIVHSQFSSAVAYEAGARKWWPCGLNGSLMGCMVLMSSFLDFACQALLCIIRGGVPSGSRGEGGSGTIARWRPCPPGLNVPDEAPALLQLQMYIQWTHFYLIMARLCTAPGKACVKYMVKQI